MSLPLIVSVSGVEGVGVRTACERAAIALNSAGVNTVTVNIDTSKRLYEFEDNIILGRYNKVDVVLMIRNANTHRAVRQRLHTPRWDNESIRPKFAVLLTCSDKTYQKRCKASKRPPRAFEQLEYYKVLPHEHWGTDTVYHFKTDGEHGRLYAAGNIRKLVMQELTHG